MKRLIWLMVLLAGVASVSGADKPNVIYILADDLGYGDLGCYGQNKLKTPNIDRIASEGMLFTDHYSGNTVCSPSRAALMTGQHPGHVHCRGNGDENGFALDPDMTTLPRLFKNAGYATGAYGKWGLGYTNGKGAPNPMTHGFDHFSGWKSQGIAHTYYPTSIIRDGKEIPLEKGTFVHDLIMKDASDFIKENAKSGKPFFCFIPTAVPHAAMHAPSELHEKWRKVYPQFDQRIGRYGAGKGEVCPPVTNPVAGFAAMMENLDNQVGALLGMLKELDVDENTVILFSSDNGAHREGGHDPDFWDSNGPLHGIKRDLYEGGIRAPFMVRWPGKVAAGSRSDHLSAFWDILPTMAELTGQPVPEQSDGISILPTLHGKGEQPKHEYIYHEFVQDGQTTWSKRCLRQGDWKAVQLNDLTIQELQPIELYNLKDDPGESRNLAAQHPETVSKMELLMNEAHTPLNGFARHYIPEEGSRELSKNYRHKTEVIVDPNLPNVLIIGDSISIGYTELVRAQLKGRANVIHNPGNAEGTTLGLAKLEEWLGDTKWDVIHFNWGLHDLKHVTAAGGNSNDPNDPRQADLATYTANMDILVKQLKATGARLIFATTTPYPDGVKPCRLPEDAVAYNAAALSIMRANNIQVNDLYSLVLPKLKSLQKPANVHFRQEGSELLADEVAAAIQAALPVAEDAGDMANPLILDMVHHIPGEVLYDSAYENPAVIREMGYNGKVYFLFDSPMLAINWASVDPDILPKGSEERAWVDRKAARIHTLQASCREQGIAVFAQADMVLFPRRMIEKFGIEKAFGDVRNANVRELIQAQLSETFSQFPLTDGLVVRIGETYLHDAPHHQGAIANKKSPEKTIIPLLQLLRDEVCVKHNKKLIFRTWGSFDHDPNAYQRVSDAIEPHPNLMISIKHCEGDFHRGNPFSRSIGQGRHPQIIEVQCAREYEGKGAYPNYIARGVIEGFEEHARMPADKINSIREFVESKPALYGGIWTWSRGGGWAGPYIKNEFWCDLNAWVLAQWAADPTQSEKAIFHRYAKERLGLKGDDINAFRKLCLLSADAVVRGLNSTHGDMDPWWTRDQGIGWPDVRGNRARNLKQKDESIAMWEEIVKLAQSIQWPDEKTRHHAVGSATYGLRLYEIYRNLVYLDDAEKRKDREAMLKWLQAYDDAWVVYKELPQQYPDLATLYTREYERHMKNHAESKLKMLRAELAGTDE